MATSFIHQIADGGMLDASIVAGERLFRLSNDEATLNIERLYNDYVADHQSKEKLDALESAETTISCH